MPISIRAPTRGATSAFIADPAFSANFNPRSHEGSDFKRQPQDVVPHISIRAPTRGATHRQSAVNAYLRNFNPRSHEGSDERQVRAWE